MGCIVKKKTDMSTILIVGFCYTGSATYTTSSLSTKSTSVSDPPNICKVKPQQLQSSGMSSINFTQLGCAHSLLPQQQQQQTPHVFVSQSAAGTFIYSPQHFEYCFCSSTSRYYGSDVWRQFKKKSSPRLHLKW